jgi:cell division protein FtsI (penicillin-binding protein 3)
LNSFFKPVRTIIFFVISGIAVLLILFTYAKLAVQPISAIAQNKAEIERGSIVDRSGFPLAVQTNFYHVGVSTKNIRDDQTRKTEFAHDIAPLLDLDETVIQNTISSTKSFVYLKKKIDSTTFESVKKLTDSKGYNFVSYEKIPGRNYPNHDLASQLIGYMGDDGKGLAGIEFSQQDILSPEQPEEGEPVQAKNVFLSIDANLQYKLEKIARKSINETQAESMMLIAADATNGEILSYISFPSVDLNNYSNSSPSARIDRPAMNAYEPGSVFKIFSVGIVYDNHGISPNETFVCDGVYEKRLTNGERIRIKCLEHHGTLTARDAIRFSCNDVLGQISDRIGEDDFIARIRGLGFGQKTGVELPGETAGTVKDNTSPLWSARSKPTIAIGQEISVSALQMVQAATAIANGGIPVQLTFIHKITNKDGTVVFTHEPVYKNRVFSKNTSDYILSCMETTAKTGTGSRANLRDVAIGVKTGTAQMADPKGGYSDTDFISSCMAIFPVDDPQIILYIVVEKAKGETYGGRIVAPVIGEAADVIIDHLGMSRGGAASLEHSGVIKLSTPPAITIGSTLPDFTGKSKKDLLPLLDRTDITLNINGSGWVTSQNPEPGTPVTENMVIELNLE